MANGWETVVGLEVHVQLLTRSKLFSPASAAPGMSAGCGAEEHSEGVHNTAVDVVDVVRAVVLRVVSLCKCVTGC